MSHAVIPQLLSYDPMTGIVSWVRTGALAGSVYADGYVRIVVSGRSYAAHRVAWLLSHGEWPALSVDHINGDRSDNRIENLRLATPSQNGANRRSTGQNLKGVTFHRRAGRWQASITVAGKFHYLGLHNTPEQAHAAYAAAAQIHFGEFARVS